MICGPTAVPEFVSNEDDPPLKQNGGKHLQEFTDTETLQQAVKVHMFQSGVHWSTQRQYLAKQQEHMESGVVQIQCFNLFTLFFPPPEACTVSKSRPFKYIHINAAEDNRLVEDGFKQET